MKATVGQPRLREVPELGCSESILSGIVSPAAPYAWVDAGIRTLVRAFGRRGFYPTWSCSGLLRDHLHRPQRRPLPYLIVQVPEVSRRNWLQETADQLGIGTDWQEPASPERRGFSVIVMAPTYAQVRFGFSRFLGCDADLLFTFRRFSQAVIRTFPLVEAQGASEDSSRPSK